MTLLYPSERRAARARNSGEPLEGEYWAAKVPGLGVTMVRIDELHPRDVGWFKVFHREMGPGIIPRWWLVGSMS